MNDGDEHIGSWITDHGIGGLGVELGSFPLQQRRGVLYYSGKSIPILTAEVVGEMKLNACHSF